MKLLFDPTAKKLMFDSSAKKLLFDTSSDPGIALTCDSISASKSKCGFGGETCFEFGGCYPEGGPTIGTIATSGKVPPEGCGGTTVWSVSGEFTPPKWFLLRTFVFACNPACSPGETNGITQSWDEHTCVITETGSFPTCGGWQETRTDTDEYTTERLKDNTEAALPSYDNDYNDSCSASRDLADDESTYTIQRFKPKFTIAGILGADLAICYDEHFVPDGGGAAVDAHKSVTIPAGQTSVISDEVFEPDTDGVITITHIRVCT